MDRAGQSTRRERPVCEALTKAMRAFGAPQEVLTDTARCSPAFLNHG